ncbi:MAG: protein kinase, partial [Muribaculaceae bacterium]|nr:protein kinase [Muribaculaceae bacterium]
MIDNDIPCLPAGTVLTGSRQYTIASVIGAGGFGITYMALTEVVLGNMRVTTRVAVKEHFLADHNEREASTLRVTTPGTVRSRKVVADSLRDFLGEARRLQSVSAGQKAIVKVNEVFEANGTAYYVMEYLEGSSLWDAVAGRGMAEGDMLALMQPIIEAVAYLHANRLTHLDIKPQNIMLATEGAGVRPVLIDFGLSKHYDEQGRATSTINTLACSDGYSPAEQYSGITTFTPSADVYSLGATMIACLTGQTPPKSTEWSVGDRLRYVDSMNISEPLREALRGALADPANRLPDASALANILTDSATRPVEGRFLSKESALRFPTSPSPRMVSSNDTRPVERQYSTAGPSPVNSTGATRLASSWRKPGINNSLPIILIALAAVAIGIGAYFAFRSGNNPQPLPSPADTLAIAQTLETDPVAVDNSAAEAERQRLAEQERQRQEEAERQRREEEQRRQVWHNHRTPRNLYLAVNRGGNQYYFSQSDWSSLSNAQKSECSKVGVVIKKDGQEFILALNHESGEYTWDEAISRFGNR